VDENTQDDDLTWLVACASLRRCLSEHTEEKINIDDEPCCVKSTTTFPTWAAYNTQISTALPITRLATPPDPLLAVPEHEWQTLLTVLSTVGGENRKTVITLDMGLYQPAMKLLFSHADCRNQFIRPSELHTVMAM